MKLIEIKKVRRVIFVGDTHGDLDASQKVIRDYLPARNASLARNASRSDASGHGDAGGKPGNKIVFLGDYVDRGSFSKENLDYLLEQKIKYPKQIYLLQGNHEGHHILEFSPAEFWESLGEEEHKKYTSIVEKLPLAVVTKDIIALHGVLPDVKNLKEISEIKLGSEQWLQIAWGDFVEAKGKYLGVDPFTDRPQFGKDWFFEIMKRFGKKVLIRSHQPTSPLFMFAEANASSHASAKASAFNDRCLTIFTSSAYTRERTIAIADLSKEIKTAKDLEIKRI